MIFVAEVKNMNIDLKSDPEEMNTNPTCIHQKTVPAGVSKTNVRQ